MLNVLAAILITLCMSFGVMLRYAPFTSVITPGQKRTAYIWYIVLTACNVAVLTAALHIWGVVAAFTYLRFGGIVYAVILMLVNVFIIPGRTREHLFVFGVVITCNYLLMTVPNYVIAFLPGSTDTGYLFVVLGIYTGILLLTHFPLRKLLCDTVEPFLHLNSGEYWNTVWFIPIAFFGTRFLSLGGEHDSGSIQQLLSGVLYILVIILMCISIAASQERIRQRQDMEKQLASQKLHYAELRVRVEEAWKTRHDFKHHIAAIRHFMDIGDTEGLQRYCDELAARIDGQSSFPYTGNAAADGVLYHYMQLSEQENIDFRHAGTFRSHGIADVDLCALLGNALDNALAGCLTIAEGRSIHVISQSEKHMLSIVVRNTFDGVVKGSGDDLLSRKRADSPGIGIASMRSICERCGGSMQLQWDEHNFTVMFILPLSEDAP